MSGVPISIRREGSTEEPVKIRSDTSGKFSVQLTNGNYKVVAEPEDKSVKLVRQELDAVILHSSSDLEHFVVNSFSVKGQVRTQAEKGKPIAGARVSVSHGGQTVDIVTADDGSFVVPDVRSSPMSAKVVFEGFDFDAVTLADVDPGVGFPVIAPARYLLTGKVERDSLPAETEVRFRNFAIKRDFEGFIGVMNDPRSLALSPWPDVRHPAKWV